MPAPERASADQDPATLKVTYDRLCHERDRLRDARGIFAHGLGPAPASAGIATGIVAALGDGQNRGLLLAAVAVLGVMVLLSTWYGGKVAYRHLYAKRIKDLRPRIAKHQPPATRSGASAQQPEDFLPLAKWYHEMIRLEREIYGSARGANCYLPPWGTVKNLQDGADLERTGALLVQALWIIVIGLLVIATVA